MKKLKLNLAGISDVLTKDQMKQIGGGYDPDDYCGQFHMVSCTCPCGDFTYDFGCTNDPGACANFCEQALPGCS